MNVIYYDKIVLNEWMICFHVGLEYNYCKVDYSSAMKKSVRHPTHQMSRHLTTDG